MPSIKIKNAKHPGFFLKVFLKEQNISIEDISAKLESTTEVIQQFIDGHIDVDNTFGAKLSKVTGTSPSLWINLQNTYNDRKPK